MGLGRSSRVLAHLAGGRGPGLLLLIALTGYTVKNAWKNDVFFSWSYFSGWLALPFSLLAGNLDNGKRVKETVHGRPPSLRDSLAALPGKPTLTSERLPNTHHCRPGRDAPDPQTTGPGAPPGHPPTRPTFLYPPSTPLLQASAFCWRT